MIKPGIKTRFLLKNLLKGGIWFAILIVAYLLLKNNFQDSLMEWIEPFIQTKSLVYLIFIISELFFGVIPPEIFILWATGLDTIALFILNVFLFSILSYIAGTLTFLYGLLFEYNL